MRRLLLTVNNDMKKIPLIFDHGTNTIYSDDFSLLAQMFSKGTCTREDMLKLFRYYDVYCASTYYDPRMIRVPTMYMVSGTLYYTIVLESGSI